MEARLKELRTTREERGEALPEANHVKLLREQLEPQLRTVKKRNEKTKDAIRDKQQLFDLAAKTLLQLDEQKELFIRHIAKNNPDVKAELVELSSVREALEREKLDSDATRQENVARHEEELKKEILSHS